MDVRLVVVAGLLVVSSVSAADAAVACPCFADCGADPPYVQFGESCFRHHWAALGWTEARAACARDGGVLAENVGYLVHADSRIDTWIGARAASSEPAELRWQSSGEPLVDGLPQNVTVHPSTFPEGGCAFILESHIYVWSECDDPLAFICERPVVDIVPAQLHLSAARAWGQTHGTGASTLSLGVTSPLLSSNPGSVTKAVVQPRNFRFALAQVASSTVSFSVRQSACQQLSASHAGSPVTVPRSLAVATYYVCLCPWYGVAPAGNGFPTFSSTSSTITVHAVPEFTPAAVYLPHAFALSGEGTVGVSGQNLHQSYLWIAFSLSSSCSVSSLEEEAVVPLEMGDRNAFVRIPVGSPTGKPLYLCWSVSLRSPAEVYSWASTSILLTITAAPVPTVLPSVSNETFTYGQAIPGPSITVLGRNFETRNREETYLWYATSPLQSCEGDLSLGGEVAGSTLQAVGKMVWTADGSEAYTSITASKSDGCISSCLRLVSVPEDLQGSQEYGVSIRFLSGSRAGVDVPANVTHRMVASPSVTGSPTLVVSASDYYSGGALQLTGAGFDFAWVKMVAESCSASGNPAKVGAGGAISFSSEDERLAPGSERLLCLAEGTTGPLSGWFSAGVVVEVRNMPQFEPELWAPSPGEVWGSAVPYSIVLQGLDLDQALEYYHCAWKETEPADCVTGCSPPQHSDAGIVSLEFDYARAPGKRQVCWQLHDQQPGEDGASTGVVVLVPNLNPFSASATTLTYSDALFAGAYFPLSNVGAGVEGLCGALVPATAVSGGFAGRNCAEIEIFSEPASGLLPAPLSTASAGAEHVLLLSYNGQTARFFATDNRVTWDAAPSFDASGTVMPLSLGDLSSGVLNLTLTARHLTPGFTIGVSSNLCTDTISAGQLSSPFRLAPGEISSTGAVTLAIPEPFRASLPAPASTKAWLCWAPIDPSSGLSSWTNGGDTGIELQFRSTPSLTSGAATEHVDIEVKRYDLLANGQPDFVVSIDGARLSSPLWVVAHTVSCAEAYSQRTPFSFIFSLSVADETAEDAEDLVFDIKGWDSVLQTYVSVLEGVKLGEARLTSVTPLVGVTELRAYWTIINPFTNTVVGPSTEIQDWVHNLSSYPAVTVIQDFELPSAIPPLPNTNPLVIRGNDLESAFFALSPVDAGCESITTAALLPLNVTAHMGRFLICISVTGAAQSFYPVRQAPVLDLYDPLQITAAPILTSEPSVLPSPQVPEDFTNIPCLDEEELGEMSDGLSIVLGLDTSAFNSGLFTAAVAASLKVLPHHVVITSVSAGSVVVDFFIQGPNASQDQDTLFHLVEEQQNPFESFQWDILSLRVAAIFEQPPEVRITSTDSDSLEEKLQRIFRLACLGAAGVCVVMVLGLGVTRMRGYRQLQDQRRSPKRLSSVASDNGARSDRTTALGESSGECKRTKAVPIPPGLERFNPPEAADSRSPAALRGANAVVRSPVFSPRMPVSAPPFTQPLQPVISASSCHHSSAPTSRANSLQQLAPLSVPSHGFPPLPAIPATMESI
eukprot:gene4085-6346_t